MPQARIKTTFGEVVIPYSDVDELARELEKLPKVVALVQSRTGSLVPSESRKPRPGDEALYEFDASGRLRLLKKPNKQVALAALALWANDPEPMAPNDLELVTGIPDVVRSVLSQTNNRKYFVRRDDGRYGVSLEGFEWVTRKVAPSAKTGA
jgi:hypothetical protein